jgi:hypothetical protein
MLQLEVGPEYLHESAKVVEVMGHIRPEDSCLEHFISRTIGNGAVALDVYSDMVSQVYNNPKYNDLFCQMAT